MRSAVGPTGSGHSSVAILAPAPLLTVTIESGGGHEEIHLHPGGQGVWIARMVATFGIEVILCATFGGESGQVVRNLIAQWDIDIRSVEASGANGTYVHDRRTGRRHPIAEIATTDRSRHEVDELYGALLVAGLEAGLVVLGGPEPAHLERGEVPALLPADFYTRCANDLRQNGVTVVADLSGPYLDAAVDGGLDLVKVSDEDLAAWGQVPDTTVDSLSEAGHGLCARGAAAVVITRAELPALVIVDGGLREVHGPTLQAVDARGAGDSFTAGIAAGLARGADLDSSIRLGAAAGTLNVSRRGLGSGSKREIELLSDHVTITPLGPGEHR